MIIDASKVAEMAGAPGEEPFFDVCIVGAGAAGITIAHDLAVNAPKLNVLLLESSRVNERTATYGSGEESPFLKSQFPFIGREYKHRFEDPFIQRVYCGTSPGNDEWETLNGSRVRCYGGTTNCWGGWIRPLSEWDFNRSDITPMHAWPIGLDKLDKYYAAAINIYCSLGQWSAPAFDDRAAWKDALGPDAESRFFSDAALGNLRNGVFAIMADTSSEQKYDGRLDFQLVFGPTIEKSGNVRLVRNANVRRINFDTTTSDIASLSYTSISPNGAKIEHAPVRAKRYVLATGCMETARLLLLADPESKFFKDVGKSVFTHPLVEFAGWFTAKKPVSEKIHSLFCDMVTAQGCKYPPRLFATLVPRVEKLRQHYGNFRAWMGFPKEAGEIGTINLNFEQFADLQNNITINNAKRDPVFGDPSITVTLTMTDGDQKTYRNAVDMVSEFLYKNEISVEKNINESGNAKYMPGEHLMGATKMGWPGKDKLGSLDPDCRVKGAKTLFVTGAAVFPTGGHANPTLTIVALALRLSDYLRQDLAAPTAS